MAEISVERRPAPRLTPRQQQVVTLIADGYSNLEIAEELGISARTVKAHCDALRVKLRCRRRRLIPRAVREAAGGDPLDDA